jgi:pantothenate kinase
MLVIGGGIEMGLKGGGSIVRVVKAKINLSPKKSKKINFANEETRKKNQVLTAKFVLCSNDLIIINSDWLRFCNVKNGSDSLWGCF